MKRLIARRPTPAMIVAVIALIAALTGTAFAGGFLSKKAFRNQSIRGPLIYVSTTPMIPAGQTPLGGGPGTHVSVDCPGGTNEIGGGIKLFDETSMLANDDYATATGWAGTVFNSAVDGQPRGATVTAICATVKQVKGPVPPN
jgi:hypothetical protein